MELHHGIGRTNDSRITKFIIKFVIWFKLCEGMSIFSSIMFFTNPPILKDVEMIVNIYKIPKKCSLCCFYGDRTAKESGARRNLRNWLDQPLHFIIGGKWSPELSNVPPRSHTYLGQVCIRGQMVCTPWLRATPHCCVPCEPSKLSLGSAHEMSRTDHRSKGNKN